MGFPSVRYTWSCLEFLGGVLFGLSLLGLIGAFLLGSWAALLKTYLGDYADLATPGEGYLWPITLCLTIVFVAPVHILGLALRSGLAKNFSSRRALRKSACSGSSLDRRIFLHVVLSCLSSFLVLGTCAGGAFFWSYSRRRIRQGLQKVVRNYSDNESAKLQMDRLQMELRCCGIDSYADWFFVPWTELYDEGFTESDKNYPDRVKSVERRGADVSARGMRLITADVPFSCCATKNLRECIHRGIGIPGTGPSPTIATVGCQTKLLARANDAGRDIVACLLFVSAYQLTLSILSRLLQTARLNAIQTNVKGKHFVGWIFGHGPPNPPNAPNVLNVQPRETQRLRVRTRCHGH